MNTPLLESGFEELTEWEIRHDRIKPAHLDWVETSGWIYAFATDNGVEPACKCSVTRHFTQIGELVWLKKSFM
jgi:hypothetical protein